MELKEEITRRQNAGYSRKEIIAYLIKNGHSEIEIEKEFPKLKSTNNLYRFILILSIIVSLIGIALIFPFLGLLSIFSPIGMAIVALVYGTYSIYKLEKPGFIIFMVFYSLIICAILIGHVFFKNDLGPFSSFIYLIFIISICSFLITSIYKLYKKL